MGATHGKSGWTLFLNHVRTTTDRSLENQSAVKLVGRLNSLLESLRAKATKDEEREQKRESKLLTR